MENLKITIIQPDIIWENAKANLEKYSGMLENIKQTDVIILPEMFTTGFSMQPEKLKETMDGASVKWMQQIASDKNAALIGSLIIEEAGKIYNRAIWVFPEGKIETYDKRHLYSMGQEHLHYASGKDKLIVEYKGWKFCPQICYDLRFPVFARNLEDYDVVFYMANWPSARHHVWKNLLISRAIENQAYCFGVNRVGTDGIGLNYLGDSGCISPKGFPEFMGDSESIQTYNISYSELHNFRQKFPLLNDRDTFSIL
ncbi:Predicted amidohydrolase [Draconibacterium orientale]|uniref:Omega-amidase YafV n=2 Tax=Draconibacterium orientale TaxID=1168034 RepID=X5DKD3_9BACT|nr:amidohydrolase [Draconibacterium orientale]SET57162.1 Predicted amidohydrolase [Draconibacterium orientale]